VSSGIQLTLKMGPVVVAPAPQIVMDALESVEVTHEAGANSAFQMTLRISNRSALNDIFLIATGPTSAVSLGKIPLRVMVIVTINGTAQPLFDGVMTNVQVNPGQNGAAGQINITGDDLTRVMTMFDWSGFLYPAMPIQARVIAICAKYAMFGILPMAIPSIFMDVPLPTSRIPTHDGNDLEYIQQMAEELGYVFYIEPGPTPGTNIAYFGPEIKVGVPQPALNLDMDAHTNVESLNFNFDSSKGVLPVVFIQNPLTRAPIPIPIPDINPLQPPLGLIPAPITNLKMLKDTAKLNLPRAIARGVAEAARSQDAVSANGSLNVLRYGRLLKARGLVGVRGAGVAYDGLYFVQQVKTTISRGDIKQSFNLTRNGLVSITPKVPA
jgi:hypothetical protein